MNVEHYEKSDRLLVAADCIIFGFDGRNLKVLLVKRSFEPQSGRWSLMGGFVRKDESVNEAAIRILQRLTGLKDIYMEQLYCFGEVHRDSAERVISIAYFALINIADYSEQLTSDYEARWFPLNEIPDLIFDHRDMVLLAKERLKQKVINHPIGFALLPEKFTLPQLQNLYEAIYENPLDRRNFSRKILSLGILRKLNEKEKHSSKKGAFLFVFDKEKYLQLEHEGMRFI
ncbi:MAG TPA: NUDIX domain-containing protein [Cyclobacteriaceae bacterium]|nr:NUDIX domain-containing protein [Cyclobacteriaceae bacterium]